MVPGVVGRRSTAAVPAGRLRIAHCIGQHRRPQLVDAVTPRRTAVVRQLPVNRSPSRHVSGSSTESGRQACAPSLSVTPLDRFRYTRRDAKGSVLPLGGAEPIPRGVGECRPPYLIRWFRFRRRLRYGSRATGGRITRATSSI